MSGDIHGITFSSLQLYTELTATEQDDTALQNLNQKILEAVPDASPDQVSEAIDRIKQEHPNWTMDQVFEAAVRELNPQIEDAKINEIRNAWTEFTGVSNLSRDDISQILASPIDFVHGGGETNQTTLKSAIAALMLLMIELAGEESANELLIGCKERDNIMEIAKEKAELLKEKAITNLIMGLVSAGIQIGASMASFSSASKGMTAAKAGDGNLASAYGGKASAWAGLGQAGSAAVNAVGTYISGMIDAEIAIKDGESQVAQMNKEIADKMRQKATELIQACLQLLQSMAQADYQTMTAIGRA